MASFKGIDTFTRETTLAKLFLLPSEKGSSLKGKNLLPRGANSFIFRVDPYIKEYWFV